MTWPNMLVILFTGILMGYAIGIYLEGKFNTKLWRISQAVKLHSQNDLAGLQQFYDYVKGVVEKEQ